MMNSSDYGLRPARSQRWEIPVTEMTNRQLLHRILDGQQQIREFIMTAASIVEAATATITSADTVIQAATKVIGQADTSNVPAADLAALSTAQQQLGTDTAALQQAVTADQPTTTTTATSSSPVATSSTTATATSTADLRAAEIRDSHLS